MKDENRFTMQQRLRKEFHFEGSHFLTQVPEGHPCGRMHGHSYKIHVYAMGFISRTIEWVVDYAEISEAVEPVIATLDHRTLNDVLPFETTAENLAFWIGQQLCRHKWLHAVEVFETPTAAVYLQIR